MKKLLFTAAFAAIGLVGVNAQTGLEGTVHVGIPVGDTADVSSFNLGVDLAYLWPVANDFGLGVKVGYDHFIGKDYDYRIAGQTYTIDGKDYGFIPLAATAKYEFPSSNIFVAGDLGYAFATNDGVDGGLFWQPKLGYAADTWDLYVGYKGITAGPENNSYVDYKFNTVSVGFAYKF